MITYEIDHEPTERKISRNPRATNWDLYRFKLAGLLDNLEGPLLSVEELERETTALTEAI